VSKIRRRARHASASSGGGIFSSAPARSRGDLSKVLLEATRRTVGFTGSLCGGDLREVDPSEELQGVRLLDVGSLSEHEASGGDDDCHESRRLPLRVIRDRVRGESPDLRLRRLDAGRLARLGHRLADGGLEVRALSVVLNDDPNWRAADGSIFWKKRDTPVFRPSFSSVSGGGTAAASLSRL
jgi:hypothetical protein